MKICQGAWVDTANPPEAVPCKWCGKLTAMLSTKMCDRCWELDGRIRRDLEIATKIIESLTTKHKTMNDIILVVLPDGSVHRATLIEPDLGAPVYKLGKLAGAKERKPRTQTTKPLNVNNNRGPTGVDLMPAADKSA